MTSADELRTAPLDDLLHALATCSGALTTIILQNEIRGRFAALQAKVPKPAPRWVVGNRKPDDDLTPIVVRRSGSNSWAIQVCTWLDNREVAQKIADLMNTEYPE